MIYRGDIHTGGGGEYQDTSLLYWIAVTSYLSVFCTPLSTCRLVRARFDNNNNKLGLIRAKLWIAGQVYFGNLGFGLLNLINLKH